MTSLIFLGVGNWIATLIVTDSELSRPLREWVTGRYLDADDADFRYGGKSSAHRTYLWRQAKYLLGCPLCVGLWVALAQAIALVHPILGHGVIGITLTALAIKAIGHASLELVAVLKKVSA